MLPWFFLLSSLLHKRALFLHFAINFSFFNANLLDACLKRAYNNK